MTYANVAMTLALVFAMTGGALAASHKSKHAQRHKKSGVTITSTKQISSNVLAALKGNTGPAGPQGPAGTAGAAGAKGDTGPEGKAGKDGANGKSVLAAEEAPGKNCAEGGTSLEEEGTGVKDYACNGKRGANGLSVTMTELAKGSTECEEGGEEFTIGTEKGKACNGLNGASGSGGGGGSLKKGETERGLWSLQNPANMEGPGIVTVTYPRPLVPRALLTSEAHVIHGAEPTKECPGNVQKPEAAEGNLCLYYETSGNIETIVGAPWGGGEEEGIGFLMRGVSETATNQGFAFGSWAVTAG